MRRIGIGWHRFSSMGPGPSRCGARQPARDRVARSRRSPCAPGQAQVHAGSAARAGQHLAVVDVEGCRSTSTSDSGSAAGLVHQCVWPAPVEQSGGPAPNAPEQMDTIGRARSWPLVCASSPIRSAVRLDTLGYHGAALRSVKAVRVLRVPHRPPATGLGFGEIVSRTRQSMSGQRSPNTSVTMPSRTRHAVVGQDGDRYVLHSWRS